MPSKTGLVCVVLGLLLAKADLSKAAPSKDLVVEAAGGTAFASRRSPLVELVQRCWPAAVDVIAEVPAQGVLASSGVIVHESGYIFLVNHMIPPASRTTIVLHNGKRHQGAGARLREWDLFLMKIAPDEPLTAVPLGRSDDLMLGESVFLIGNPGGIPHSVSQGIVSGLARGPAPLYPFGDMFQTNASTNHGSEGAPVVNALGQLVGLIGAKHHGVENVGFAIPVDRLRKAVPQLASPEARHTGRLGVTADWCGPAVVLAVAAASPAEKAGMRTGDVIQKIGAMRVSDCLHFHLALFNRKVGEALPIEIRREGKVLTVTATLDEAPRQPADKAPGPVSGTRPAASQTRPSPAGVTGGQDVRRSPLVTLVDRCIPAVADLSIDNVVGTGTVLSREGYVLTNNHVAKMGGSRRVAAFSNGKRYPFRVIALCPDKDLAVVKIEAAGPLPPMATGRSGDLRLGEPVFAIGSGQGYPFSVSPGTVTGLGRGSAIPYAWVHDMIQTDAAISGGNSGGPVINADGQVIGVVNTKKPQTENIAFLIPIDLAYEAVPRMLAVERRYGFRLGLTVAGPGPATVAGVEAQSPAEKAGIRPGDVIRKVGVVEVDNAIHFHLALVERRGGESLPMELDRHGRAVTAQATLQAVPMRPAEDRPDLVRGLSWVAYAGENWHAFPPDLDKLKPVATGRAARFSAGAYRGRRVSFVVRFTGCLHVPADGLYTFYSVSDDGSRLWIGNQLILEDNELHPPIETCGVIRLKAGKHPITVEYLQGTGGMELAVSYEGPTLSRREIPSEALFCAEP